MNMKLNNVIVNPHYKDLFTFKSHEDKIQHNAQMISLRILNQIEKICEQKSIKKKDLAEMIGSSRSYITQLFNGSKSINTSVMAKLEDILNLKFEINLISWERDFNMKDENPKKKIMPMYCAYKRDTPDYYRTSRPFKTDDKILKYLETADVIREKLA